jgi:hypothetical protein
VVVVVQTTASVASVVVETLMCQILPLPLGQLTQVVVVVVMFSKAQLLVLVVLALLSFATQTLEQSHLELDLQEQQLMWLAIK